MNNEEKRAYARYKIGDKEVTCIDFKENKFTGIVGNISNEGMKILFDGINEIQIERILFAGSISKNLLKVEHKYTLFDENINKTIVGIYIPDQKGRYEYQQNIAEYIKKNQAIKI